MQPQLTRSGQLGTRREGTRVGPACEHRRVCCYLLASARGSLGFSDASVHFLHLLSRDVAT